MPNPLGPILGALDDAASDMASNFANSMMKGLWNFAAILLSGVFGVIDEYTAPNVDPTDGPLAGLLPMSVWLGLLVLIMMSFVQIGQAVMSGGRGFARIFVGLAQYVAITGGGLTVLATMVTASDSLAIGILKAGLGVDTWKGISGDNSALTNETHAVSGVGLGVIALLCIIPAALGFLLESLARSAAILVLAGTIPILAAGLVADATRRWFWTGLRWMLALLFMHPGIAFAITIGMKIAQGTAGAQGQQQGPIQATVSAAIGGLVLLVALICPLALFKLFAFVDPNSLSGAAVRGVFSGRVSATGGAGGGGSAGSSESSAESDADDRFLQTLATLADPFGVRGRAQTVAATASSILDTVGAGHRGGPGEPAPGQGSSRGSSQTDTGDLPEPDTDTGGLTPDGDIGAVPDPYDSGGETTAVGTPDTEATPVPAGPSDTPGSPAPDGDAPGAAPAPVPAPGGSTDAADSTAATGTGAPPLPAAPTPAGSVGEATVTGSVGATGAGAETAAVAAI